MTQLFAEGFAHYGVGTTVDTTKAPYTTLLSGTYAAVPAGSETGIGLLPWDPTNTDLYFYSQYSTDPPLRRVLPVTTDPLIVSMYYAVDHLPAGNGQGYVIAFADTANSIIAQLICESTGALSFCNGAGTVLATTGGPVVVAESAVHLEMEFTWGTGANAAFKLYASELLVLNLSGLAVSGISATAQLGFIYASYTGLTGRIQYASNIIVRNTAGTVNNAITGDRRVATLFVNADDAAHQGWTGRARHRFGAGVLDNRSTTSSMVTALSSTTTDLGSGNFTIEASVRFLTLPTGSTKAVIFGKWDEGGNRRSYQLYKGGATLESGNTVFRISTDGTAGTVTELISWPWAPATNTWYHVAISRAAGETMLFVDGVQQGLPVADAHVYYAGTETTAMGGQYDNSGSIAGTALNGFMDEVRLTVGYARYAANFTPPSAAFPRGSVLDAQWAYVALLCGFDTGVFDESSYLRTLTAQNGAVAYVTDDGAYNFQTLDQTPARDDTFIEAALLPATGILTQVALPVATKTVTVGTKDGAVAAVYTWVAAVAAAFDVKIGVSANASLANLVAAINAGAGAGTLYGTGTTANYNVSAVSLPLNQMQVTALAAGTAGNSIASSTTDTNGSWGGATLSGGVNIPGYSQFSLQRPPPFTTIIDSISIVSRTLKTDSGTCTVQAAFVGSGGGVGSGAANPITTTPTYYQDIIEVNPDTAGALTPTALVNGKIRLTRTA